MSNDVLEPRAVSRRFRFFGLVRGFVALGLIITIALCLSEFLLRVMDLPELRKSNRAENVLNGGDAVQADPELGWMQIPNAVTTSGTGNRTVSVRHNQFGLRERELGDDAPNGTIIFLGDSMVWGMDAEVNERFTDLLQTELPNHRMINAGVLGFGTDQEYLLLRRLWSKTKPRVVALTFSVDNDRDDNSSSLRYRTNYKPYFVRTPQYEWMLLGYPLPTDDYITDNGWVENFALARFVALAYSATRYREIIVPDPTEHVIDMMRRFTQAHGSTLVVGLQRHEAKLENYLRSQNIAYTSFDEAERYPIAGGHWKPEGQIKVAKKYMALFADAGLLSSASAATVDPGDINNSDGSASGEYLGNLLTRNQGVLSPFLWIETMQDMPEHAIRFYGLLQFWGSAVKDSDGLWRGTMGLLILTVLHTTIGIIWLWWRRHITVATGPHDYIAKALASFRVFFYTAITTPLAAIVVGEALEVRMIEITYGLYVGITIAAFGQAVAAGLLAPNAPYRRLPTVDDQKASLFARQLFLGSQAVGWLVILLAINKALAAAQVVSSVIKILFALAICILILHFLFSTRGAKEHQLHLTWLRLVAWLSLAAISISLIAGYINLGAVVAERLVAIAAVAGAIDLLVVLIRMVFIEWPADNVLRNHVLAGNFGVKQRWLDLALGITTGCVVLTLVPLFVVLVAGPLQILSSGFLFRY